MREAGQHCAVEIEHKDETLNAFRLIELSRSTDSLTLRFINSAGESHDIPFDLNRHVALYQDSSRKASADCHFIGDDDDGGYSSLSTCSLPQLGGILTIGRKRFVLAAEEDGSFYLLSFGTNDCKFPTRYKRAIKPANYYGRYLDGKWRYVELAFVADHSMYEKYNKNSTAVTERLQTVANHMNALYMPLNFRVSLVWADIWVGKDPISVEANSDTTLSNFLEFRKTFIKLHHNDNAHLLTNVRFDGNVVGKAYRGTICSFDYSGGVNMDHSKDATFVAATVAHELGHNLGMEHDTGSSDCNCADDKYGCIMAPSSGGEKPPTFWSECSLRYLQKILNRKADYCLLNQPKEIYGGARCGNSIVEDGEECDCGSTVSCSNKCCDPKTCKLVKDAECANGDCCDLSTCKVKPATTRCRDETNTCDLPEYCDGQMEHCPADFYVQDGHPCPDYPEDFCSNGICGNRDMQCRSLWGSTGKSAHPMCYQLNTYPNSMGGNCGYDEKSDQFIGCLAEDKTCGRLQCVHQNEKHELAGVYSVQQVYTPMTLSNREQIQCRVVFTKYKKEKDPGMVLDGAECGDNMMCVDAHCKNRTDQMKHVMRCKPENCNNAGICNNMGNCHCKPGYGGTDCAIPGHGGSVNSGPANEGGVFNVGFFVFWFLFALFVAFCIATYFVKRRKNVWLHKEIWKKIKVTFNIRRMLVPIRKAPPPPAAPIRTAELNALWGESSVANGLRKPNLSSAISPPVIPSGSFPPHSQPVSGSYTQFSPRMSELQAADKAQWNSGKGYSLTNNKSTNPQAYVKTSAKPSRQNSTASTTRPTLPPPGPPVAASGPPVPPHKPGSSSGTLPCSTALNGKSKPALPTKPVVASKSKVKDIAALFDPKSSQLVTNVN